MDELEFSQLPINEEVEVSPGFLVERRQFILGSAAALLPLRLLADDSTERALDFDSFLSLANDVASKLVGDTSADGQDRYLNALGELARQLKSVPAPARWIPSEQGTSKDSVFIGVNPGGDPFTVLHWRLEPGATVRPHAHTYGNVVTLGLEGGARVDNYEVLGPPDFETGTAFRVQRTARQVLAPGSVNRVSLHRNYIHGMQAGPDGARGLDITTRLLPKPDYGTPYLKPGAAPVQGFEDIFEASWEA